MILTWFPYKQKTDLSSHPGLFSGQGLFETILYEDGIFWFIERHLHRLKKSAEFFNYPVIPDSYDFEGLHQLLISKQIFRARIKLVLYVPETKNNPHPYFFQVVPLKNRYPAEIDCDLIPHPVRDKAYRQHKTISYGPYLHLMSGLPTGKEVIFTENGCCLETPIANIFAVYGNQIVTPPLIDGILPGIIRSVFMDFLNCHEERISIKDLEKADFMFATNSIREIRLIKKVGHHVFNKLSYFQEITQSFAELKEKYKQGEIL